MVDAVHAYTIEAKMPWVEKALLGIESWLVKVSFSNASEIQLHSLLTKWTWEMDKHKQDGLVTLSDRVNDSMQNCVTACKTPVVQIHS